MNLRAYWARWLLAELGIPLRGRGRPRKFSQAQRAEAIAAWNAGESMGAVGRRFGIHASTVSRWVIAAKRISVPRETNQTQQVTT